MKTPLALIAVAALTGLFTAVNPALAQDWTPTSAPNLPWSSIASAADGTKLVAVTYFNGGYNPVYTYGEIYTSTNSGDTWNLTQSGSVAWRSVASSADGTRLVEEAAAIFGWPNYYMPFLVRAGHLKPLGQPAQNARKWFATVEIERMSCDPDWLDKAIRIVEKQIQEMNKKQRGKEELEMPIVRC